MALVNREQIFAVEQFESGGKKKKKWHPFGEILYFKDDETGNYHNKISIYVNPSQQFDVFPMKKNERQTN